MLNLFNQYKLNLRETIAKFVEFQKEILNNRTKFGNSETEFLKAAKTKRFVAKEEKKCGIWYF